MKTPQRTSAAQKLKSEVQLARFRLSRAESQVTSAKEQARLAKRRRKEAKQAARRAKQHAKLAKRAVAEAKVVLAEAEEKLARSAERAARTKSKKRPAAKAPTLTHKKNSARTAVSATPKTVTRNRPKPIPAKTMTALPAGSQTITVPRDLATPETPTAPTSNEASLKQANDNQAENL